MSSSPVSMKKKPNGLKIKMKKRKRQRATDAKTKPIERTVVSKEHRGLPPPKHHRKEALSSPRSHRHVDSLNLDDDDDPDDSLKDETALEPTNEAMSRNGLSFDNSDDGEDNVGHGNDSSWWNEVPCDTLMTMKNLIQNNQCLYIPLMITTQRTMTIPAVMEFQLRQKLQANLVSKELNQLWKEDHKVIRLAALDSVGAGSSSSSSFIAWIRISDYCRAVWDAMKHYNQNQKHEQHMQEDVDETSSFSTAVTSWFVNQGLKAFGSKRVVSVDEIKDSWENYGDFSSADHGEKASASTKLKAVYLSQELHNCVANRRSEPSTKGVTMARPLRRSDVSVTSVVDVLVALQVLMPYSASSTTSQYVLWLPSWGQIVLKDLAKAQKRILTFIKQSMYKELSVANLVRKSASTMGMSNKFVLETLVAQGKVEIVKRPSGAFVQIM